MGRSFLIIVVLGSAAIARADNVQQADALFDEAQKLRAAGDKPGACQKFGEALKLNPNAVGAILNVALCKEEAGKFASAVKLFTSARDLAREHDLEPERKAAEEHLTIDEPRVAHLSLAFTETPSDGTKIVVDDEVVPVASATDIPVDPGDRMIVVSAPGRVSWETTIKLAEKERKAIAVPKLGLPVVVKKTRVTYGKVITFVGVGLGATGLVFGIVARHNYRGEFSNGDCMNDPTDATKPPRCNAQGYSVTHNAGTLGNIGSGIGIAGGVAVGVGLALWLFAPKEKGPASVAVAPTIGPDLTGVVAAGHF